MGKAVLGCLVVLLGSAMMLGAGLLVGRFRAEERAKVNRFGEEQKVISTALAEDRAWSKVYIEMYTADGSACLRGEVKSKDDKERLRARMVKLFGEARRIEDLVGGVDCP